MEEDVCVRVSPLYTVQHKSSFHEIKTPHKQVVSEIKTLNRKTAHGEPANFALGSACLTCLPRNCRLIGVAGQSRVLVIGFTGFPAGSGFTS